MNKKYLKLGGRRSPSEGAGSGFLSASGSSIRITFRKQIIMKHDFQA
ncbi:hypothetical protein ACTHRH_22865 [Paenibacillus sp. SAFN-117]